MNLEDVRQEIDRIDGQIKELFLQRMQLADQVCQIKKETGAPVYAPEREREVICMRSDGVDASRVPFCRAFFQQLMGISRTCQYLEMEERNRTRIEIPEGEGSVELALCCKPADGRLAACLNAAALAGLSLDRVHMEGGRCQMRLSGDFSTKLAKAAILQIIEETA